MQSNQAELPFSPNQIVARYELGNTYFHLIRGNLLLSSCQVIVNPSNLFLRPGGGVSGAIYHSAGHNPFQECADILHALNKSQLEVGEVVLTGKGHLPNPNTQAITHAVGPAQENPERELRLHQAYQNSLKIISSLDKEDHKSNPVKGKLFTSIAFPSISTGIFLYPLHEASLIAIHSIKDFLTKQSSNSLQFVELIILENDQETLNAYLYAIQELLDN